MKRIIEWRKTRLFKENGYIFDLGFQVYNTAYEVTNSLLDMDSVNLNYFKPGAVIHDGTDFQIISDPLRDIKQCLGPCFQIYQHLVTRLGF